MAIAGPVVATSATGAQLAVGPQGRPGNQGPPGIPGPAGSLAGPLIVIVNAGGAQAVTVRAGYYVYVDLLATGGNVTLNPTGIGAAFLGFTVKLIGASIGAYTCTINPMVAGSHIESRVAPGSLTTSLVLGAPGDGVTLGSPDGINLYYS